MVVKRIAPLSLGKILGLLYAIIGIVAGLFFAILGSAMGAIGALAEPGQSEGLGPFAAMTGMGLVSIVVFPIFYGVLGFIGGLIVAALYNLFAGMVGGIEIETA
jgi:hypothetical protein